MHLNIKTVIIIITAFGLGFYVSHMRHKLIDEYVDTVIEEFYVEEYLFNDIQTTYYIAKLLNEIRNKNHSLNQTTNLERLIWINLELINFKNNPSKLNKEYQEKLNYINDYKNTYIKKDPNKQVKNAR